MTPADPDMLAVPDPDSLVQLPWKPEVGWLAADPWMEGKPVEQAPRQSCCKRVAAAAAAQGCEMQTGVECEFFLIAPDGTAISDGADRQNKPCYDQSALMRRYDVISRNLRCDAGAGLGPYQNDHEDANGQFEMNWQYAPALVTADRHAFFKYMVKSIAEKHGLRATFMPKPFADLTGSGCHAHVSLWQGGRNVFADAAGELGLSALGYQFIGGVLAHARGAVRADQSDREQLQADQRAGRRPSGATWSPNTRNLRRQQPHPHDPHPRCRALRVPPRRRRRQPVSAAGRAAGGGDGRHRATSATPGSGSTSTCTRRATRSTTCGGCR